MEKRWVLKQVEDDKVEHLRKELKIREVLCRLLVQRGIHSYDEAKLFFRPSLDDLHDPFEMKDMTKAIERIEEAIAKEQHILIYGDYDVDGTTSVALVYTFFKEFYNNLGYYIPDRYKEGYGISVAGIDYAKENNYSLIIALDCGIKALDQVSYAAEQNIDFIICDHHRPGDRLPEAVAVLDPKRDDCNYPYDELSGCGIGFKLAQAFAAHNDIPFSVVEKQLDLVAISIASDIVPITGENRVLAYHGLKRLNENPRKGIRSLTDAGRLKGSITISDIVFVLGPRINAAGRMEHANKAVELLISDTDQTADSGADILDKRNVQRRLVDKEITAEALAMIEKDPALIKKKTTVLLQPHWHKGVIGIVASRLIETHYRPTIVFTENEGILTGSARSIPGFDIYEAIKECSSLLDKFGGHMYAAGLSLRKECYEEFQQKFEDVVASSIDKDLLIPEVSIDAELHFTDISGKFYDVLSQFEPFGPGNRKPVFLSKEVRDKGDSKILKDEHLKLSLTQDSGRSCKGIAFGMASKGEEIINNLQPKPFDICYTLEENKWGGYKSIELNVKDIKIVQ